MREIVTCMHEPRKVVGQYQTFGMCQNRLRWQTGPLTVLPAQGRGTSTLLHICLSLAAQCPSPPFKLIK